MSRAHVLNKATEYIREMQRNSAVRSMEIDELKKKNEILEEQGKLFSSIDVHVFVFQ